MGFRFREWGLGFGVWGFEVQSVGLALVLGFEVYGLGALFSPPVSIGNEAWYSDDNILGMLTPHPTRFFTVLQTTFLAGPC